MVWLYRTLGLTRQVEGSGSQAALMAAETLLASVSIDTVDADMEGCRRVAGRVALRVGSALGHRALGRGVACDGRHGVHGTEAAEPQAYC